MKIKFKATFVAIVTLVDIMVILLVVMSNDNTNIKNDVSTKTAANIISNAKIQPKEKENPIVMEPEKTIEEEPQEIKEEPKEEIVETQIIEESQEIKEEPVQEVEVEINNTTSLDNKSYDEMTLEEKNNALLSGTLQLEYSALYTNADRKLTKQSGVCDYNGHHETYYDEKSLPGTGLNIPGRHVADDGTIRDGEGYICVAANYSFMPKGSILITSLGPAKVYDTGCAYGTIDIYVNW